MEETAAVTSRAADTFIPSYYRVFDRQRHLLPQLYGAASKLLWNGNAVAQPHVRDFLLQLPPSNHHIHAYDAQPVPAAPRSILVTVSGSVSYSADDNPARRQQFYQQFILRPDPDPAKNGAYVIVADTFRFV